MAMVLHLACLKTEVTFNKPSEKMLFGDHYLLTPAQKSVIMSQWKNYSQLYIQQTAGDFITVLWKIFIQLIQC